MSGPGWSVLCDLGGVVLSWAPERAFADVLDPAEVAAFLAEIDFGTWNRANDAGRPFAEAEAEAVAAFPHHEAAILAYRRNFDATLTGMVPGTGGVLAELAAAGVRLAALTNWSGETFPVARARFGLLRRFDGILVSGDERLAKPDPAVFALAVERFGLDPARTVFVDDSPANVDAAAAAGLTGLHFTDADTLRADLVDLGLLGEPAALPSPAVHLTEASAWRAAEANGHYPWSSRDRSYEAEGFVHASFDGQVKGIRQRVYADVAAADLVVVELPLGHPGVPVVVENDYPHLFAPLPVAGVTVHPYRGA